MVGGQMLDLQAETATPDMEKIILDCDPATTTRSPSCLPPPIRTIDLLGITTVSGNHNVDNTTRNALATCTAYGIKVPVAKGSSVPIIIDQVLAIEIHGETGLDGPELPPASFELDPRHGVDFIIDTSWRMSPRP
jgi:purine nucleosidase